MKFHISRINTEYGTMRLTGNIFNAKTDKETIELIQLDIMGTDGWVGLDINAETTIELVNKIMQQVQNHLNL
ncbi:hypothetical protein [Pseudoalteromonas sp. ASV78]|uniref:hypothetical protein n=1 Tax=Pseudoalteromonas sp. ASV78 TaxID=3397851 RepID=UPI0039FC7F0E